MITLRLSRGLNSSFALFQVYIRLDQPMAALEVYRTGLDKFPSDVSLLTGMSRIYEALGNITLSAKYYKMVLNVSAPLLPDIGKIS